MGDGRDVLVVEASGQPVRRRATRVLHTPIVEHIHRRALRDVKAQPLQIRRVGVLVVVRCLHTLQPVEKVREAGDDVSAVGVVRLP